VDIVVEEQAIDKELMEGQEEEWTLVNRRNRRYWRQLEKGETAYPCPERTAGGVDLKKWCSRNPRKS